MTASTKKYLGTGFVLMVVVMIVVYFEYPTNDPHDHDPYDTVLATDKNNSRDLSAIESRTLATDKPGTASNPEKTFDDPLDTTASSYGSQTSTAVPESNAGIFVHGNASETQVTVSLWTPAASDGSPGYIYELVGDSADWGTPYQPIGPISYMAKKPTPQPDIEVIDNAGSVGITINSDISEKPVVFTFKDKGVNISFPLGPGKTNKYGSALYYGDTTFYYKPPGGSLTSHTESGWFLLSSKRLPDLERN